MESSRSRFIRNLKRLMKQNHYTAKKLAPEVGVSQTTVLYWRCGYNWITADRLDTLARLFNVDVAEFFKP